MTKSPTHSSTDELERARAEADRETPAVEEETEEAVHGRSRLRAALIFEIIQREGSAELARSFAALWWSGMAAGIAIGFSVISEAMLTARLPDEPWKPLVDNLGYSVGFLIVILARQQLFTENTLTAVLPVIARWDFGWLLALLRLWGIVLAANLVGCFLFALFLTSANVLSPDVSAQVTAIGLHLMQKSPVEMFTGAIVAGWLIASLVWMLPSSEGNEFPLILLITYLIALGDFAHVIAGSAEVFYLFLQGTIGIAPLLTTFFLPTLIGNIVGGTFLFGLVSYAQVREEIGKEGR